MKIIVEFFVDYGRSGDISGVFTTTQAELDAAIGGYFDFGEALGKHSEVTGRLTAAMVTVKSSDQDFIAKFEEVLGAGTISGYNPVEYIQEHRIENEED